MKSYSHTQLVFTALGSVLGVLQSHAAWYSALRSVLEVLQSHTAGIQALGSVLGVCTVTLSWYSALGSVLGVTKKLVRKRLDQRLRVLQSHARTHTHTHTHIHTCIQWRTSLDQDQWTLRVRVDHCPGRTPYSCVTVAGTCDELVCLAGCFTRPNITF